MMVPTQRLIFENNLSLCFVKKMIDDSNFVRIRWLMLYPTLAATLSREDFKAEAQQTDITWYNIWKHSNILENVKSRSLDKTIIWYCRSYLAVRHAIHYLYCGALF